MRAVILGDFHIKGDALAITEAAMEDIRACHPDLIVALGDFGQGGKIGFPEGIAQAAHYLAQTGAPIAAILGNHDLQEESAGKQTPGTMQAELGKAFGLKAPYGFVEYDQWRFLLVTSEPQPPESCWQVQECYVSDEQFAAIKKGLALRPGVPVIVFSHAPPLGCGLRTVHNTHLRATNAYLDQNHDPFRWKQLYEENDDLLLWFSGHYHLGHHHADSQTQRNSVTFFHTQVHGPFTRDGVRLSRVLDLSKDRITVSTLDHDQRVLLPTPDWSSDQSKRPTAEGVRIDGNVRSLFQVDEQRLLLNMDDGFLWEANLEAESVMGALHKGGNLDAVAISGNFVWRAWGPHLGISDMESLTRFVRSPKATLEDQVVVTLPEAILSLEAGRDGRAWATTASGTWECDPITRSAIPKPKGNATPSLSSSHPVDKTVVATVDPDEPMRTRIIRCSERSDQADTNSSNLRHDSQER